MQGGPGQRGGPKEKVVTSPSSYTSCISRDGTTTNADLLHRTVSCKIRQSSTASPSNLPEAECTAHVENAVERHNWGRDACVANQN